MKNQYNLTNQKKTLKKKKEYIKKEIEGKGKERGKWICT